MSATFFEVSFLTLLGVSVALGQARFRWVRTMGRIWGWLAPLGFSFDRCWIWRRVSLANTLFGYFPGTWEASVGFFEGKYPIRPLQLI